MYVTIRHPQYMTEPPHAKQVYQGVGLTYCERYQEMREESVKKKKAT